MVLFIDKNDLDMNLHSDDGTLHITSVVDTRGFVSGESGDGEREDYKVYFENPENICILTTQYSETSNGQLGVIEEILKYNMKRHYDTGLNAILVNWKTGEPDANLDNQSGDEMEELGEEFLAERRKSQVSQRLKSEGKYFNPDNVLMYNPMTGYEYNNRGKILMYDRKEAQEARTDMIQKVMKIVKAERMRILEKIQVNYSLLDKFIKYGDISIRDESIAIIQELKNESIEQMNKLCEDLHDFPFDLYYRERLNSFHSRAYKPLAYNHGEYASNVGYGLISLFKIDVPLTRFCLEKFNKACDNLEKKYQDIKRKCKGATDEKDVLALLDNFYSNMIEAISKLFDDELRQAYIRMLKNDRIFGEHSDVWGKACAEEGTGVNARIRDIFHTYVGKREMRGLSDDFPTFCKKKQDEIEVQLPKIIDACFGRKE